MPTVTVKVPVRGTPDGSTFPGFGSAGIYWLTGETTRDVTDEQLKQLLADSASAAPIMVQVVPDAPAAAAPAAVPDAPAIADAPKPTESKSQKSSK